MEELKSKFLGHEYLYIKKPPLDHPSQFDKLRNLRDGPAIKKGLLIKKSRIEDSNITLNRNLKDLPSSIFHND